MSNDLNRVMIIGRLGADPETRYMPSGKPVTNLRIATSDSWKDKQTGDKKERTEWHSVTMFDGLAQIAAEYLSKGAQVFIEGKLQTRKWQAKDGSDRYTTEIVASGMQMLAKATSYEKATGRSAPARTPASDELDDSLPF